MAILIPPYTRDPLRLGAFFQFHAALRASTAREITQKPARRRARIHYSLCCECCVCVCGYTRVLKKREVESESLCTHSPTAMPRTHMQRRWIHHLYTDAALS